MTVPYNRQTLDTPNPIARFAHKVRYQRALELAQTKLISGGTLLDIGCGDGTFLQTFAQMRPDTEVVADTGDFQFGTGTVCIRSWSKHGGHT